jgi:hypothetical protein
MQQIADLLKKLGLGQYAQSFAENDINFSILSDLTDQDLKELGVSSLGHRRQLLRAIAQLTSVVSGEAGIGKSRLTAALLERLASEPHTRLRYFCSPQHTDSAFYPIISQMERAGGLARERYPTTSPLP